MQAHEAAITPTASPFQRLGKLKDAPLMAGSTQSAPKPRTEEATLRGLWATNRAEKRAQVIVTQAGGSRAVMQLQRTRVSKGIKVRVQGSFKSLQRNKRGSGKAGVISSGLTTTNVPVIEGLPVSAHCKVPCNSYLASALRQAQEAAICRLFGLQTSVLQVHRELQNGPLISAMQLTYALKLLSIAKVIRYVAHTPALAASR